VEHASPIEWLAATPAILVGVALWVVGWLALELAFYRRGGRRYSLEEARTSLGTLAIVSAAQIAVSLALLPILFAVWPYRLWTLSMDAPGHWLGAWVLTDFPLRPDG